MIGRSGFYPLRLLATLAGALVCLWQMTVAPIGTREWGSMTLHDSEQAYFQTRGIRIAIVLITSGALFRRHAVTLGVVIAFSTLIVNEAGISDLGHRSTAFTVGLLGPLP